MATPVDISSFTEEQKQLFNRANTLGSGVQVINSTSLSQPEQSFQLPPTPQVNPQEFLATTQGALQQTEAEIARLQGQSSQVEQTNNQLITEFLSNLRQTQGRDQAQLQAETQAGIPEQQKRLQELTGRLTQLQNEALAIPLQIQEESVGLGRTTGGVEPIQTARLRQNAIQSLTIGAQAQALQGNIALAQQQVNRAVDLEFKPIEDRLDFLKTAYTLNKDILDREDKKRSEQLQIQLDERARILNEQKIEKNGIYDVMTRVASFGAPQSVVDSIRGAKTLGEAISLASPYMQDPAAKVELQNAVLGTQLKKIQIQREQQELNLLNKYGGMSPSEYATYLKNEQKAIKEASDAEQVARQQGIALGEKVNVINAALNSPGLGSTVGTTPLGRPAKGLGEAIIGSTPLSIPQFIGGTFDVTTGARQNFIASVENLVSREFLDNLINVKAQGATFGALTEKEQLALTQAATKIGTWRLEDKNGKVIGYNASEKDFRTELERIRNLTRKAYEVATGSAWTDDEQSVWDALESVNNPFNPQF